MRRYECKYIYFIIIICGKLISTITLTEEVQDISGWIISMHKKTPVNCAITLLGLNNTFGMMMLNSVSDSLIKLNIPHQKWIINDAKDADAVNWALSSCSHYIFMTQNAKRILEIFYSKEKLFDWNGSFTIVVRNLENMFEASSLVVNERIGLSPRITIASLNDKGMLSIMKTTMKPKEPLFLSEIWNPRKKLSVISADSIDNKPLVHNFEGETLPVYTFNHPPAIFATPGPDGILHNASGVDILVVKAIGKVLNFKPLFKDTGPDKWGQVLPNNTHTGIVGKIQKGKGILGVANMFMHMRRLSYVSFTMPYDFERACVLTSSPKELPKWQSISFPFSSTVWILFCGTIVCIAIFNPLLLMDMRNKADTPTLFTRTGAFMYSAGVFLNEPMKIPLRLNFRQRIFIACTVIAGFITTMYYSTNLTAFLLVKATEPPITSFKQLKEKGIPIGGFGDMWFGLFETSANQEVKDLFKLLYSYCDVVPEYRKIAEGKAFITGNERNLQYIEQATGGNNGQSPLRPMLEECIAPFYIAAIVKKNSPYKSSIDMAILRMVNGGLIEKFVEEVLREVRLMHQIDFGINVGIEYHNDNLGQITPLGLEHMQGIFLITVIGYLCSLFVFIVEQVFHRYSLK